MTEVLTVLAMMSTCIFAVFEIVCIWITYTKVGIPGWKSLIPIYNLIVLLNLANTPKWMIILLFIPFVGLYPLYLIYVAIAEHLGKPRSTGIFALFFPYIAFPIFAFTSAKVQEQEMNQEEEVKEQLQNQGLMEGPIEAIGARPDLGEEEVIEAPLPIKQEEMVSGIAQTSVVEEPVVYHDTIMQNIPPIMDERELTPLEPVVQIQIDDPLAAQQKVQYVEEEKEVFPDVNIYKTCPNCGNKVEPNATSCFLCGKRLEEENNQES